MAAAPSRRLFRVPSFHGVVLCALLFALCAALPLQAAPRKGPANPTVVLAEIVELFHDIKSAAKKGAWGKAEKKLDEVSRTFYAIAPEPADRRTRLLYQRFGAASAEFKMEIAARDIEGMALKSLPLQMVFCDIMDRYECPFPPAFVFLEKDTERAIVAFAGNDFDEIRHEIMEVAAFYPRVRVELVGKGVPEGELEHCQKFIEKIQEALSEHRKPLLESHLTQLQGKVAYFKSFFL